jgi:IclR family acetate operon transcriptional repressor
MKVLEEDRKRGFSLMTEMYAPGMSAMAAPVRGAAARRSA